MISFGLVFVMGWFIAIIFSQRVWRLFSFEILSIAILIGCSLGLFFILTGVFNVFNKTKL